jgi:beta-phosphoglucomutase-like phosphatase (HAD superfamily)
MTYPNRAVIFDVDGTLSDSWKIGYTCTQEVLKKYGYEEITERIYHEGTKYSTPRRFSWHICGNPDDPIGIKLGDDFDNLYVNLVSQETTPLYPGIFELLQRIYNSNNNIKLATLSNACGAYVQAVLRVNNLSNVFTVALGADEVPKPKPYPDGLIQCSRELNILPSNCIYIGDSPSDGIAAQAAGMSSIGVSWGSHSFDSITPAFSVIANNINELEENIDFFIETGQLKALPVMISP